MNRRLVLVIFICAALASLACSDDDTVPENNEESKFSRVKWSFTSTPVSYKDETLAQIPLEDTDRGELLWFSATTVQVADIDPAEDAENIRNDPVSALEVIYIPSDSADAQHAWGGLVHRTH